MLEMYKMESKLGEREYIELRAVGKRALATVLKQKQNVDVIEKYVNKSAEKNEEYETAYKKILYQAIGDILKGIDLKSLAKDIKKEKIGWNHPTFTNIKNKLDEHDEFIINPFEVEEGVTACRCGSVRVFTYQRQVRSLDEPSTTFAQCVQCKAKWTYSG
jgi:DNA-directed RNA polymerase subunit M/transcription elongation factor TFIIS